jgi:FkbM family methyltransferase
VRLPSSWNAAGRRCAASVRYRLQRRHFGLRPSTDRPASLGVRIDGRSVDLVFPPQEKNYFVHEFHKIFLDDCYGLRSLGHHPATVLDIGANLGLFSLAARHRFPRARIHAYEPNRQLESFLHSNLAPFHIDSFFEALGAAPGHATLQIGGNSLLTQTIEDPTGPIPLVPLAQAVARLGGKVDLIKLDCEGAEWSLFHDAETWASIRNLTMEYHLWPRPGVKLEDLLEILRRFGFANIRTFPSDTAEFGLLWARR